jgi:hypothetical protein
MNYKFYLVDGPRGPAWVRAQSGRDAIGNYRSGHRLSRDNTIRVVEESRVEPNRYLVRSGQGAGAPVVWRPR